MRRGRRAGLDVFRRRARAEIDDELAFHLQRTVEELTASGVSREDAEQAALRRFGPLAAHRDVLVRLDIAHELGARRRIPMDIIRAAVRSVVRGAGRSPAFTFGIIAVLALGLGVNAITFTLVDRLVLSGPAGIEDSGSLRRAVVHRASPSGGSAEAVEMSYPDYRDMIAATQLAGAAAESPAPVLLGRGADAERIMARLVTANYFDLLGTTPAAGRMFTADESERAGARLVVLGHDFWRRRFNADLSAIGRELMLDSQLYTIVGIAPRFFTGTSVSDLDVFLPLEAASDVQISGPWRTNRGFWWVSTVVRLADGAGVPAAEAELTALYQQARAGNPNAARSRVTLTPLNAVRGAGAAGEAGIAGLLAGVALIVLVIAIANVTNLFFARSLRRDEQSAVRLALGSSRRRLVAEAALEGALLASLGAVVAVLIALAGAPAVQTLLFPDIAWLDTAVNLRGLIFVAACAVAGGGIAAAIPVWRTARADVVLRLRSGARFSRPRTRAQAAMLTVQAALSVVLLVGAGLFVRSLDKAGAVDLGIDASRLVVVTASEDGAPIRRDFATSLEARMARLPTVERTARVSGNLPFVSGWAVRLNVPGLPERPRVDSGGPYVAAVTPGYFDTAGTRVIAGRGFTDADRAGAEMVAIVNESMARLYWPGRSALGECLEIGPDNPPCSRVVGVVENSRRMAIVEGESLLFYVPLAQAPASLAEMTPRLLIRTSDASATTLAQVAEAARRDALAIEPGLAAVTARPLDQIIAPQLRAWRTGASLFGVFGLLALLVATVGFYSVMAFDVAGRRREIGVRAALGASSGGIARLIMRDGVRLAAGGVLLGLALAWIAAPGIESVLYEVAGRDAPVFTTAAALLLAAGAAACVPAALRAARIGPSDALREE